MRVQYITNKSEAPVQYDSLVTDLQSQTAACVQVPGTVWQQDFGLAS